MATETTTGLETFEAEDYSRSVIKDIGITMHIAKDNDHVRLAIKHKDQTLCEVPYILMNEDDIRTVIRRLESYLKW